MASAVFNHFIVSDFLLFFGVLVWIILVSHHLNHCLWKWKECNEFDLLRFKIMSWLLHCFPCLKSHFDFLELLMVPCSNLLANYWTWLELMVFSPICKKKLENKIQTFCYIFKVFSAKDTGAAELDAHPLFWPWVSKI